MFLHNQFFFVCVKTIYCPVIFCAGLNRELLKLKDEKCDLYVRYTTALEEKSASIVRNRDLQLEVRNQIVCVCTFAFYLDYSYHSISYNKRLSHPYYMCLCA